MTTYPLTFHDGTTSPVGGPLACPSCGGDNVEIIGTPVLGGAEMVQTDAYEGLLGFRGDEWQLRATCYCEAVLTLCMTFHKGVTFIGWHVA